MLLTVAAMVALACGMAFLAVLTVGLVHEAHAVAEGGAAPRPRLRPARWCRRLLDGLYAAGAALGAKVSGSGLRGAAQHRLDLAGNPAGWNVRRAVRRARHRTARRRRAGRRRRGEARRRALAVLFAVLFGVDLLAARRTC